MHYLILLELETGSLIANNDSKCAVLRIYVSRLDKYLVAGYLRFVDMRSRIDLYSDLLVSLNSSPEKKVFVDVAVYNDLEIIEILDQTLEKNLNSYESRQFMVTNETTAIDLESICACEWARFIDDDDTSLLDYVLKVARLFLIDGKLSSVCLLQQKFRFKRESVDTDVLQRWIELVTISNVLSAPCLVASDVFDLLFGVLFTTQDDEKSFDVKIRDLYAPILVTRLLDHVLSAGYNLAYLVIQMDCLSWSMLLRGILIYILQWALRLCAYF